MRRHLPGGVRGGGELPHQVLCSAQRQGLSVSQRHRVSAPQRHRVCVPQRHTVSVRQRHTVSVLDRPAKKIDFRIERAGVRDETWGKFKARPGEVLQQNQEIQ